MPKILAFAGSSRDQSYNKKLVKIAALGAEQAGAMVSVIDLADYPMPIFNQDLEKKKGIPENAAKFKQLLIHSDAFLIASPEYNGSFSPLLKNAIDWASRSESEGEPPMMAFKGKFAVIMAASPGRLGGLRGLIHLRMLLTNLGVIVLPEQQTIPQVFKVFDKDGSLIDKKKEEAVLALGSRLTNFVKKSEISK
jgi:NAD(P)H-dependent FMN reductase